MAWNAGGIPFMSKAEVTYAGFRDLWAQETTLIAPMDLVSDSVFYYLMAAIVQGQIYPTLADFKNALREWSIEANFTPSILDSDSHRVRAGCRSSADCPFRIRANYTERRGCAKVTTCHNEHTCDSGASHDVRRPEVSKLKFLVQNVPNLLAVGDDTSCADIIEAVERKYGQKIQMRQAQKVKQFFAPKSVQPCKKCGLSRHTRGRCPKPPPSASITIAADLFDDSSNDLGNHGDSDAPAEGSAEGPADQGSQPCPLCLRARRNQMFCPHGEMVPAWSLRTDHGGLPQTSTSQAQSRDRLAETPTQVAHSVTQLDPILEEGTDVNDGMGPNDPQTQSIPSLPQHNTQNTADRPVGAASNNVTSLRTVRETRMEAARLMQQAARLMQEAAKLNSEAARLTASVAGS